MIKLAKKIELESNYSNRENISFLISDGASTANRAQIQIPGNRGNLSGSPAASWIGWIDPPATTGIRIVISMFGNSPTASDPYNTSGFLVIFLETNGNLIIRQISASNGAQRAYSWVNFRQTYLNSRAWVELKLAPGTDPILQVNGVFISGTPIADISTPSPWLSDIICTYCLTGFNWPASSAPIGCWINAHLTDAESETWRTTGKPPIWVSVGGSQIDNNLTSFSNRGPITNDLNSPTNGFEFFSGASSTGFSAQHSGTNGSISQASKLGFSNALTGTRWRVRFDLSVSVGNKPDYIGLTISGASPGIDASANLSNLVIVGSNDLTVTATANFGGFSFICFSSQATNNFTVSNFSMIPLGAISIPSIQSINVLDDITSLGGNQSRLLGMNRVNVVESNSRIVLSSQSFASGTSVQILGGDVIGTRKQRLISISGNSSASVNISMGTSSGGTQLVNAQAVNGVFDISTFVSRIIPSNSSLWITFSGNTTASVEIRVDSFNI